MIQVGQRRDIYFNDDLTTRHSLLFGVAVPPAGNGNKIPYMSTAVCKVNIRARYHLYYKVQYSIIISYT